jgi:hypothetical protein
MTFGKKTDDMFAPFLRRTGQENLYDAENTMWRPAPNFRKARDVGILCYWSLEGRRQEPQKRSRK